VREKEMGRERERREKERKREREREEERKKEKIKSIGLLPLRTKKQGPTTKRPLGQEEQMLDLAVAFAAEEKETHRPSTFVSRLRSVVTCDNAPLVI
jgi:hypothetical protein